MPASPVRSTSRPLPPSAASRASASVASTSPRPTKSPATGGAAACTSTGADPAVAEPPARLDEPMPLPRDSERPAQIGQRRGEGGVAHGHPGPDVLEELRLRDQAIAMAEQVEQQAERLGAQRDRLACPAHLSAHRVDLEVAHAVGRGRGVHRCQRYTSVRSWRPGLRSARCPVAQHRIDDGLGRARQPFRRVPACASRALRQPPLPSSVDRAPVAARCR